MSGYTPLFGEIVTSSIWNEDNSVRIVWITLMALADMDGNVMASIAGLAPVARVPLKDCKKAIDVLSSPDEYSRSQELQGRRITPIEGGWHLVNHHKYRQKAKSRAEYMRKYREEKKKNQKEKNTKNSNINTNANSETDNNTPLQGVTRRNSYNEDKINPTEQQCIDTACILGIPEEDAKIWYNHYAAQDFKFSSGVKMKDIRLALQRHKSNGTLKALVENYKKSKQKKIPFDEKAAKQREDIRRKINEQA